MKYFEYVCEIPTGFGLFRRKNTAGGYDYLTDELGAIIWDTALVSKEDILCAIVEEEYRRIAEIQRSVK